MLNQDHMQVILLSTVSNAADRLRRHRIDKLHIFCKLIIIIIVYYAKNQQKINTRKRAQKSCTMCIKCDTEILKNKKPSVSVNEITFQSNDIYNKQTDED